MTAAGIIGSMAWLYDAGHLRIVWFHRCDNLAADVDCGKRFATKPLETYAQAKRRNAEKSKRHRARQRIAA